MVRFLKLYGLTFQDVPSLNKAFFQHNGMIVRAFVAGAKEDDIELLERERERERKTQSKSETETGVVFITLG